ncbi:MAG TPA: 2-phospho-L-lactate guanylyltransferase [Ktedonobacteraceae bacterium]|nr:2-phospho-L-lactate guanylyltransferase [Ktedonobacteraceae bacterium]
MTYRAIVPVKTLTAAKSRLADHLSAYQRQRLVLYMLHHVLDILHASEIFECISVVSADDTVLKKAQSWGATALVEELAGHNPALHAAALREREAGASSLLTISADLPLLKVTDIHTMVAYGTTHPIVLASSREGTGTNAVLMRPPLALPYLFGVGSLQSYQKAARQRGLSAQLYQSEGLALDVDTIEDLHELQLRGKCFFGEWHDTLPAHSRIC